MKRVLCMLLCLMMAASTAFAETADTLQKLLVRQLTAGYGLRGYASITASGVADWLNYLLPFTVPDIQIRAIGEKQGTVSGTVNDDDDWQVRFFAKNGEGEEVGTTWLYGNPEGIYFQSELLPGKVLNIPVTNVHLLYQLMRGDLQNLFFSFDPMDLLAPGVNGNVSAYQGIANVLGVTADEWEDSWLPVLEKYFLHLDLWLMGYGDPDFITGETGGLTMTGTYTIPAADLKKEAKYLIGQMIYDNELQELLIPHVTMEQRITYLNPSMVYFYEACIDALPLEGDVVLSREMSAMGDIVSTSVSLPLPPLPEKIIAPIGEAVQALLELPYADLLSGMNRIVLSQKGGEKQLILSGTQRTVELTAVDAANEAQAVDLNGAIRITPNIGVNENYLSAKFSLNASHRIWQDEEFDNHDTTELSLSITPDLSGLSQEDPFRSAYVEFAPVSLDWRLNFRNDPYKDNSPVQINLDLSAKLPDAEVTAEIVLRITTQMAMEQLTTSGAEDITKLSDEMKDDLLETLMQNAVLTMANLGGPTSATEDGSTSIPSVNE